MSLSDFVDLNVVIGAVVALVVLYVLKAFVLGGSAAQSDKQRYGSRKKKTFVKPAVPRDYTAQEVASHNSLNDCWLIIDGKVYDVTSYVSDHPGGDSIARKAGLDNSEGFHGPQHGDTNAPSILEDYRVGQLKK